MACLLLPQCVLGQSNSFTSVPRDSWPYATYRRLVNLGFAQPLKIHNEFSGTPTLTRYEFAVITDRLQHRLSDKKQHIANQAIVTKAVDKLAKEFRLEINQMKSK